MKTLAMYSTLLLLFVMGCSSEHVSKPPREFQTREEFLDYLMEGYLEGSEPLYLLSSGHLEKLHKALGLGECDSIYAVNKGELLIFEKYHSKQDPNELGTLVLSDNAPPQFIRSPEDLWDGECRIFHYTPQKGLQCLDKERFRRTSYPTLAWHGGFKSDDYLKFYNGYILSGSTGGIVDVDRRFVCYSTITEASNPEQDGNESSKSIYIISVDNPKMKVQSRLKWSPDVMVINNNHLYLVAVTPKRTDPLLYFEVYDIMEDNELKYVKDCYVNPPFGFAISGGYIFDYDFQAHSQQLHVYRDFPLPNSDYLYNYDENRLIKMSKKGYHIFINPEILKNSVQYIDLDKLRDDK